MAQVFLRLPHYVASYLRNKDREHPLEVGSVVALNPSERVWAELAEGLYPNANMAISPAYCFNQRQWKLMMGGFSLLHPGKKQKVLTDRYDQLTLTDSEIRKLTGLPVPRGDDSGEYICINIPREAPRFGKLVPTNTFWQLRNSSAKTVRTLLVDEFWRTLYAYVDKAIDKYEAEGKDFVTINILEAFMERYDIRCSADGREREALKRNYNRRRKLYRFTEEDFIEYG